MTEKAVSKKVSFKLYTEYHEFQDEILSKLDFLVDATAAGIDTNVWGLNMMNDLIAEAQDENNRFWEKAVAETQGTLSTI